MGWLSDWRYRRLITVDNTNIDSDLTHFPVPIILGASVGQSAQDLTHIFDVIGSNYQKLAVTKDDGATEIYVEVEHWDATAKEAVLWVSSSDLTLTSASSTELYIYYDSSRSNNTAYIGDPGSRTEVWDSDFAAVYHFSQDPSGGTLVDSTVNSNDGTPQGSMTSDDLVDGQVSKGWDFDGGNDVVEVPDDTSLDITGAITVQVWNYLRSLSNQNVIANVTDNNDWLNNGFQVFIHSDDYYRFQIREGGTYYGVTAGTPSNSLDTWKFLCGKFDGSNHSIFVDLTKTTLVQGSLGSQGAPVNIGAFLDSGGGDIHYTDSIIDEIRISSIARSDAWIRCDYYAQTDDLLTYGSVQTFETAWLSDYAKRRKITVDPTNIDSPLTHFPIPIIIGASSGIYGDDLTSIFDELGSSYKKLAVTKADGETELYVEVEQWDATNEKAVLWVSKSDLTISSGEPTTLYIYYDASKADNVAVGDPGSRTEVWDSDFAAVYHFSEDPSGGVLVDSTSNGNDGTVNGSLSSVDGLVGEAFDFDGTGNNVEVSDDPTIGLTFPITLQCWFSPESLGGNQEILVKRKTSGDNYTAFGYRLNDLDFQYYVYGSSGWETVSYNLGASSGIWYLITVSVDASGNVSIYDAGVLGSSGAISDAINPSYPLVIGDYDASGNVPFDGKVDEVQISAVARSAAWIKTDYYAQTDSLLSYGGEETYGNDFWLGTYAKRIQVFIGNTQIDSDLTHFPVPIILSAAAGKRGQDLTPVFDEVGSSYLKLAVTKADGVTQIYAEVEQWDSSNEKAVLWVSRSDLTLSSTEVTELYIYYDAEQADNTAYIGDPGSRVEVWRSEYKAVFHLDEASGDAINATGNSNGTFNDQLPNQVDSKLGKGQSIDDDYIDIPKGTVQVENSSVMFGGWINFNGISGNSFFAEVVDASDYRVIAQFNNDGSSKANFFDGENTVNSATSLSAGAWAFVYYVRDFNNKSYIFIDGSEDVSITHSGGQNSDTEGFSLFNRSRNQGKAALNATVDEIRFYSGIPSNLHAWIKCDYYAQTDSLLSYALEELYGRTVVDFDEDEDDFAEGTLTDVTATTANNLELTDPTVAATGTRVSPQIDLSDLGTYSSSTIEWAETLNGETITIETRMSTDGGSTWSSWAEATNGGSIPDLSAGTDLSNALLECRQTLSTADTATTPVLHSLLIEVTEAAIGISGTVTESGSPVARTVRAYLRSDGSFVGETVSDSGDGSFFIPCNLAQEHYVLAIDDTSDADDFNALIFDRVIPQ